MMRLPTAIHPGLAILLGTAWAWSAAPAHAEDEGWTRSPVTLRLDTTYLRAADGTQLAAVHGTVHHDFPNNRYTGNSYTELTGSLGRVSGSRTAYAIAGRLGTEGLATLWCSNGICPQHLIGMSAGLALDRAGDRIPRAWTVPLDGYWYWPVRTHVKLGAVGGISWAFAGADRELGWRAGLDLFVRWAIDPFVRGSRAVDPHHVHVGAGVQRIGGRTFLGLTLGIWGLDRYDAPPV
jgi:hypothetical protein